MMYQTISFSGCKVICSNAVILKESSNCLCKKVIVADRILKFDHESISFHELKCHDFYSVLKCSALLIPWCQNVYHIPL